MANYYDSILIKQEELEVYLTNNVAFRDFATEDIERKVISGR